jgi:hypothetical protein
MEATRLLDDQGPTENSAKTRSRTKKIKEPQTQPIPEVDASPIQRSTGFLNEEEMVKKARIPWSV